MVDDSCDCRFNPSAASSARSFTACVDSADGGAKSSWRRHVASHCSRHRLRRRLPILTVSLSSFVFFQLLLLLFVQAASFFGVSLSLLYMLDQVNQK